MNKRSRSASKNRRNNTINNNKNIRNNSYSNMANEFRQHLPIQSSYILRDFCSSNDEVMFNHHNNAYNYQKTVNENFFRQRNWIYNDFGRNFIRNGFDRKNSTVITIATYNILSQNLLLRHPELYLGCKKETLEWGNRRKMILNEIDKYDPDILCLQEVHQEHFLHFLYNQLTQRGYRGIYMKRPGDDNEDGCATFFKIHIFELIESKNIDYQMYDNDCECRCNVGQIVILRNITDKNNLNSYLCVANTHFLFNPNRGDAKLSQAIIMLTELDKYATKYKIPYGRGFINCPIIFCGDFNLLPQSDLYLFLCRGILQTDSLYNHKISGLSKSNCLPILLEDYNYLPSQITNKCKFFSKRNEQNNMTDNQPPSIITHDLNLTSVYPHIIKINDKYNQDSNFEYDTEVTSCHMIEEPKNLDYILYSVLDKICSFRNGRLETTIKQAGPLNLIGWLKIPTVSDNVGPLPSELNGSDHVMLMAKFLYIS